MAYEKQTWQNGDTITAEKLNHMEDGIAEFFLITVTANKSNTTFSDVVLDKTTDEIQNALASRKIIIIRLIYKVSGTYGDTYTTIYMLPYVVSTGSESFFVNFYGYAVDSNPDHVFELNYSRASGQATIRYI